MDGIAYSPEFVAFLEELGAEETIEREFKEAVGGLPRSIWETISAFANTSGGIIVLGIRERDDGLELVGLPHPQRLVDELHSQCRNRQKINQDVLSPGSVSVRDVEGRSVVIVRVRPAERRARPIYINGQAYGGTHVRRNTGDHAATNDEVNRMMREASDLAADQVIVPWVRLDDLDRAAIAAYRRRLFAQEPDHPLAEFADRELLEAIEGYRRDAHSGEEGITVAGLLMFGTEAAIRTWRVRHLIDARLLPPGADRGEPDWADRVLWESHLFGAYNRIYPWLTRDLPVPFRLENGYRVNESEQHRALREALVNLLVHADYSERDASLILRWDGGVSFRNPGRSRIPAPGFHAGNRSDPRNPSLLRMFRRIGLSEEAGTGVPRIVRSWRELGYEPPQIDPGNDRYEFAIILPYQHLLSEEDREWLGAFGVTFTDAEQLALVIARYDDGVDNQAVREVTGLHGADASRVLTGLRNRGFLEMIGSKRGASYRLPASVSESSMMISDKSLVDSGPNLMDSDRSLVDNDVSLVDNDQDFLDLDRLLPIAEPASKHRRMPADQLDRIIVAMCTIQALSVAQLAQMLNRSDFHIGMNVRNLVGRGAIQPVFPERHHPRQRYTAQGS